MPGDARSAFGGRAEVLGSLRTSSVAEGRYKLQREIDKFEKVIAACRDEIAPAQIAGARFRPTLKELEAPDAHSPLSVDHQATPEGGWSFDVQNLPSFSAIALNRQSRGGSV